MGHLLWGYPEIWRRYQTTTLTTKFTAVTKSIESQLDDVNLNLGGILVALEKFDKNQSHQANTFDTETSGINTFDTETSGINTFDTETSEINTFESDENSE